MGERILGLRGYVNFVWGGPAAPRLRREAGGDPQITQIAQRGTAGPDPDCEAWRISAAPQLGSIEGTRESGEEDLRFAPTGKGRPYNRISAWVRRPRPSTG